MLAPIAAALTASITMLLNYPGPAPAERRDVQCEIQLAASELKAGGTGELVVRFTPEEGIHINTDPTMEFEFEKGSSAHFKAITAMPKAPKTGYLDATRPVRCSFTLDKKLRKGTHTLKGNIHYYFCSDIEGWCNRSTQPFELKFTVAP